MYWEIPSGCGDSFVYMVDGVRESLKFEVQFVYLPGEVKRKPGINSVHTV